MNQPTSNAVVHVSRWWRVAIAALLVAVALAWLPALSASFQFDDWNVVVYDAHVQSLVNWAASMPGIRPVLKLSYALNNSLNAALGVGADRSATGFRCVNLVIHLCNVLLVATLLRRRDAGAALLAALVFALHPVQTEAVTYISGRSASLAALFSLLTLHAWLRARDPEVGAAMATNGMRGGRSAPGARAWRALALLCFLLAVGCKETACVVPLLLWLWASTDRHAPPPQWRDFRWFTVVAALLLALVLSWRPYRHLFAADLAARPVALNLLTQAHALWYLLGQWAWPAHLNADPQLPVAASDAVSWLLLLLWLALAVAAIWQRRQYPQYAFGVLWFLICLLPTNSLLPRADVANDRQLYLALLGPTWCLCVSLARLLARLCTHPRKRRALGTCLAALLAGVLALATLQRNHVYANEVVFWQDVVRQGPANARAFNNLGMAFALACRDADADAAFRRSLALQPQDFKAGVNLRLLQQGRLRESSAQHCEPPPRKADPAN